jgi:hypothetical protein
MDGTAEPTGGRLDELRDAGEAMGKLADDAGAFRRAVEAFRAEDAAAFQGELEALGLLGRCRLICQWLCSKHCVYICIRLCGPIEEVRELDIEEMREFAVVCARLSGDEGLLTRLVEAVDREDVETWRRLVGELKLERFCHQLCHWLCHLRCRRVCHLLCPPPPFITQVGNIPSGQIDAGGRAAGPSAEVGKTSADNKPGGVGDHPFGGWVNIRGVFNIAGPTQYKVETAPNPAGPWTPILQPVQDYTIVLFPTPHIVHYTRVPDAGGWYTIAEMGYDGPDYLTDLLSPSLADGLYYLRLTVRNAALTEFQSPVVPFLVDNTAPTGPAPGGRPSISISQGGKKLGCCETVREEDGDLTITIIATDANFSNLDVDLEGGCGAAYGIYSKTYNGNTADTGAPAPGIDIVWNPWSAGVSPCCYVMYLRIYDRTIANNYYSGGFSNANWQSITIA